MGEWGKPKESENLHWFRVVRRCESYTKIAPISSKQNRFHFRLHQDPKPLTLNRVMPGLS